MSTTAQLAHSLIDKETDARFWAQTGGYKIGQKLDPKDPADKPMIRVWMDIYAKVKAEDAAGRLVLTYNHPAVEHHLDVAAQANADAAAHVDAAAATRNPAVAAQHLAAAGKAAQVTSQSTAAAAELQPPTISPAVTMTAAHEMADAADAPRPPQPKVHPEHPANGPRAQPSHPGLVFISDASPSRVIPIDAADHIAIAQATMAPTVAIAVHENAAAAPPPRSTVAPGAQAQVRQLAQGDADKAHGDFVGTVLGAAGTWEVKSLPTHDALWSWYGDITNAQPSPFKYIAIFDKTDRAGGGYPAPAAEMFGDAAALLVDVAPDRVHETVQHETTTSYGAVAAVAAVAATAGLAIFAGRRAGKRG